MPTTRGSYAERAYPVFMFCGLLPWAWFSSSLLETSTVLVGGGNLIRKVLFPAEVLPLVTVIAGLVNFCFGLPILFAFIVYFGVPVVWSDLLWLPLIVLVQLMLTMGLALLLSVLTVHFRDLRDLLANVLHPVVLCHPHPLPSGGRRRTVAQSSRRDAVQSVRALGPRLSGRPV